MNDGRKCKFNSSLKDNVNEGIPESFLYIHPVNNQCNQCNLAPLYSFAIALLRVSNYPLASSKGPKICHCATKGPIFASCHLNDDLLFPIRLSRGPHFPNRVIKGTQMSKIHHVYNFWDKYWLKSTVFEIISAYRDKRVKSLSRVYVGDGSKE